MDTNGKITFNSYKESFSKPNGVKSDDEDIVT